MSEEREEVGPTTIEEMDTQSEEREEVAPTTIDMTDKQISIEEAPVVVPHEENLQEQNREREQVQEESKISKKGQRRRITSYLSNISKQIEKNGNQINKITMMVQSLNKQKQTTGIRRVNQSHSQSIKQIQSQLSQLQKQVTRIQKDIQRIRTAPAKRTKAKIRKSSSATAVNIKPRSKKSKSLKSTKARKGRTSG